MAKPPKPDKPPKVPRSPFERFADRFTGARLCFGEPVQYGGTTVIPVARVQATGGGGFGRGGDDSGGGGGGHLDARPLGYIELGPAGATYHEIPDQDRSLRLLRAGAAAIATVAAGLAGAQRLRGGRAPVTKLLKR